MQAAITEHRKNLWPSSPTDVQPLLHIDVAAAKGYRGCIHCHQEGDLRQESLNTGPGSAGIYTYPLPENASASLDKDRGDRQRHQAWPAAARTPAGDVLQSIKHRSTPSRTPSTPHKSPGAGKTDIAWRDGKSMSDALAVDTG